MSDKIEFEKGSGNVFRDLGVPNAEMEHLKAQLAVKIFRIIKRKKLTQVALAKVLEITQPDVSKLKNGKYSRFSLERLLCFLNRLHYNVDIKLSPARGEPYQRVVGEN